MSTTTTTSGSLPSYMEEPLKSGIAGVEGFLNSPENYVYGSKEGEGLFTGLSDPQLKSIGNIDWLADQDLGQMFNLDESTDLWRQFANTGPAFIEGDFSGGSVDAPNWSYNIDAQGGANTMDAVGGIDTSGIQGGGLAGQVDVNKYGQQSAPLTTERLVDENGWLGQISSYMNPFIQNVLDPQIRRMNEQTDRNSRSLASQATMSGAFGDARHGLMESQMLDDANRAVSETTGRAYSDAFNTAMGQRASDIGRYDQTGQFNQTMSEAAANRQAGLEQFNVGQQEQAIQRELQAALERAGFAESGANRQQAGNQFNASAQEAAAQRAMEAAIQSGRFSESGATMDMNAALANLNSFNSGQERILSQQGRNQDAQQVRTDNLGTAAKALEGLGQTRLDTFNNVNDALFNSGSVLQDNAEAQRQSQEDFITAINEKRYNDAIKLMAAAQGLPYEKNQTSQTTQKSDSGFLGLAGSLLGSLFG
jgi:hypothetical protein